MIYNYRQSQDDPNSFQKILSTLTNTKIQKIDKKDLNIKKGAVLDRKQYKEKIIKELEDVLSRINQDLDVEYQDEILNELYAIRRRIKKQNFQDIDALIKTSTGRRIYNVQSEKLRAKRKQVVKGWELFLKADRRCMIGVYPYSKLADQKFLDKTFLFTPYSNGEAFNYSSCKYTEIYPRTFQAIKAEKTIKAINEIYMNPNDSDQTLFDRVLGKVFQIGSYVVGLVFLYFIFQFCVFYFLPQDLISKNIQDQTMFFMMIGPVFLTIFIWLFIAGREYSKQKQSKTNFQKTLELIENYLHKANANNREEVRLNPKKIKFIWESSKSLFYISVKIDKTVQSNPSWIQLRK